MRTSVLAMMTVGAAAALAAAAGCSATTGEPEGSGFSSNTGSGSGNPNGSNAADAGNGSNGTGSNGSGSNGLSTGLNSGGSTFANNLGSNNNGTPGPDGGCTGVQQTAEKQEGGRADVVLIVDNSGSMGEENAAVQANLNDFSQFIIDAGIDVHVVLIAGAPSGGGGGAPWDQWFGGGGICIEPPLGAPGACPNGDDTNFPNYMHWNQTVGSTDALVLVQNTYEGWRGMLRPDAFKTFVVVTDDEAQPPDAPGFQNWVQSQPEFANAGWRFSGIFCVTDGSNCSEVGSTYNQLVQATNGIAGDLGQFAAGDVNAQFQTVFDQIADVIVQQAVPVDCEWEIPEPPEGEELDRDKVGVQYTSGDNVTTKLLAAADESQCRPETGGWYYDDPENPTRVIACPSSCEVMQADQNARVEVVFGCEPDIVPPPE